MRRVMAVVVFVVCAAEASCSGHQSVTATARRTLAPGLVRLRQSADGHDAAGAQAALTEIQTRVATLKANGDLTDSGARRILAAAQQVQTQLALITTTTSTEPTTTSVPRGGTGEGHGKGDSNGQDNND